MTIYQCPSACGELIEGQINGVNFLSSYMINCFNQWMIEPQASTPAQEMKNLKLYKGIDYLAQAGLIPHTWRSEISLRGQAQIPIGKGMGSSTADLSAGLLAVSDYYKLPLEPAEIIEYSTQVEATDHSAYADLTVMNHVTGEVFYQTSVNFKMSVLVLEPATIVDTRRSMHEISLYQSEERTNIYQRLADELVRAFETKDIAWLAEIAWTSALLNEAVLPKPLLQSFKKLLKINGVLGLNIAHTGSVIALWFDETKVSGAELKKRVRAIDRAEYYQHLSIFQTISGGVRRKAGVFK